MKAQSSWTKPTFRELNLSMEIGMYFEDEEFPIDVPRYSREAPASSASHAPATENLQG